ncbi:MAG: hypothetical protein ACYCSJ_00915 [Acidimicrobiales bacterium]
MHGAQWLWLIILMPAGLLFGAGLRALMAIGSRSAAPAAPGPRTGCAGCPVGNCSRAAPQLCEESAPGF